MAGGMPYTETESTMAHSASDFMDDLTNAFRRHNLISDDDSDQPDNSQKVSDACIAALDKLVEKKYIVVGVDTGHGTTSFWNGKGWNYCPAHHPLKEGEDSPMLLDNDEACKVRDTGKIHNRDTRFHILNVKVQP